MFNKVYAFIKNYIKENYLFLITLTVLLFCIYYDTGYSIYKPGGIINVSDRVHGENLNISKGSFNMAYVGMIKGRLPYYLLAHLLPDWELVKNEDITYNDKETISEAIKRDQLYYQSSINIAKKLAYEKSEVAYSLTNEKNYIVYVSEKNNSDLLVGDEIISYDDQEYIDITTVINYVNTKNVGDEVKIKYKRNKKELATYAKIYEEKDQKYIGVSVVSLFDIESAKNITIDTKDGESGPSGGLILSLVIYNALVDEDITKGRKIVGTGTINSDGSVGEIGSVTYKIAAAEKKKADIFLCPTENYEEALAYAKEKNYKIIIKSVSTFEDAVNVLKQLEEKK